MSKFNKLRLISTLSTAVIYFGCAAHPSIADHTLEKGEKYSGYTL